MGKFESLILATIQQIGKDEENHLLKNASINTQLYGRNGVLDSVGLVFLITELEEKISDEFGLEMTLADEKAMSQTASPFRNIASLSAYIENMAKEKQSHAT